MPRQLRVYQYDPEGQLTDAWYNAVDPAGTTSAWLREDHFNYDPLGNRRGTNYVQTHGVQDFSRKNNGLNQYLMWSPFSLTRYDDDIGGSWGAPQHANGVLMQDGHVTAGYNALNQAIMINTYAMGSNWMFFGYDPVGRRVKRWTGPLDSSAPFPGIPPAESNPATYYYYDGWSLIEEGTGAGTTSRNYIHGARVDEIVKQLIQYNPSPRFFHYDARGHCTLQTDANGNIAEQYEYDAFGYPYFFNASGNNIGYSLWGNRFLFTGREWFGDLKLYDHRNRMYQPELGRFLQPDPKHFEAGDYNLYRYCHNDPVNRNDPMGLADSVTIEFVPGVGNIFLQILPDPVVDRACSGCDSASLMAPNGGLRTTATTNKTTGDIHVHQRIKIETWIPESQDKAGKTPELQKKELLRVDKFREGVPEAQSKANALAGKGFKDEASAIKAVEASTKREMLKKALEGKIMRDLPGGKN